MKKVLAAFALPVLFVPALSQAADKFEEKDFRWDPFLEHYKLVVIAGVNKMARENPNCAVIDPASVQPYGGTPDDPEFQVTCGEGDHVTHPHFSKTDITGDPASSVPLEDSSAH